MARAMWMLFNEKVLKTLRENDFLEVFCYNLGAYDRALGEASCIKSENML
jgi:hypothetical protein